MFKIDKNHMENNGKIIAYKNFLIIGLIKSDVDYFDKPSLSSTLSLYTKSGKFIKDLGFFDEIYDKYCLINLLSISFSLDKENGAIYYVQQATYKVTKIDINDGKVAVFGFKGNNYKPFTQGVPKKMGISHEAVFKLFCSASSLQEIGLINNRYLIAQYENANVIRNNGKILYKANNKDKNENYIQIYDIKNKKYLGEIFIDDKILKGIDNNGYLYFRDPSKDVEWLEKYSLEIRKHE